MKTVTLKITPRSTNRLHLVKFFFQALGKSFITLKEADLLVRDTFLTYSDNDTTKIDLGALELSKLFKFRVTADLLKALADAGPEIEIEVYNPQVRDLTNGWGD